MDRTNTNQEPIPGSQPVPSSVQAISSSTFFNFNEFDHSTSANQQQVRDFLISNPHFTGIAQTSMLF